MQYDTIIIGGGIVGLSTAWQLQQRFPARRILLLEKEAGLARHQTGHNSGVIHSGIYYAPGSLKAQFCRAGAAATLSYCRDYGIAFRQTGKLIVAVNESEEARLAQLHQLSEQHGLAVDYLSASALREREPKLVGRAALFVASTGIVDYLALSKSLAENFVALGGEIQCGAEVLALREDGTGIEVSTARVTYKGRFLVACAGLQSDRLAALMGLETDCRIIPVRGEYYSLAPQNNGADWVSLPIYPVPEPGVPFLGVHITPMIDGRFTVGPNAVLAWHREAYQSPAFSWRDSLATLRYPGFWRMAARHWQYALRETWDSLFKRAYIKQVQKYCPGIGIEHLGPYPPGIRAQAVNAKGELLNDFHFATSPRSLHVCNAPSPAATSALPIGAYLCDKLAALWR